MHSFDSKPPWVFIIHQEGKPPRGFQFSFRMAIFLGVAAFSLVLALFFSLLLLFHEVHRNYSLLTEVQRLELAVLNPKITDRNFASIPKIKEPRLETLDFNFSCENKVCLSKWLVHSKSKEKFQGKYLVVLETEFPKLGKSPAKKKYWVDPPAEQDLETLDEAVFQGMSKRAFSFSNLMKITSVFSLNNLVRTTTLHFYLFDKEDKLILHEVHSVEAKNETAF